MKIKRFPEAIYIVSGDPIHYSHVNTKLRAENILGMKVSLVIGLNGLKDKGLFTLSERKEIAQLYFPNESIYLAEGKDEIISFVENADKIIRGIRNESDYQYIYDLVKYYQCDNQIIKDKLVPVEVPEYLKEISSSKLKAMILDNSYNPNFKFWVNDQVFEILQKKLKIKPAS